MNYSEAIEAINEAASDNAVIGKYLALAIVDIAESLNSALDKFDAIENTLDALVAATNP